MNKAWLVRTIESTVSRRTTRSAHALRCLYLAGVRITTQEGAPNSGTLTLEDDLETSPAGRTRNRYVIPPWAWVVYWWEVRFDSIGITNTDQVVSVLKRLNSNSDARYAYLTMIILEHQVERGCWYRMARIALERGED